MTTTISLGSAPQRWIVSRGAWVCSYPCCSWLDSVDPFVWRVRPVLASFWRERKRLQQKSVTFCLTNVSFFPALPFLNHTGELYSSSCTTTANTESPFEDEVLDTMDTCTAPPSTRSCYPQHTRNQSIRSLLYSYCSLYLSRATLSRFYLWYDSLVSPISMLSIVGRHEMEESRMRMYIPE